jgi:hypothetical protein
MMAVSLFGILILAGVAFVLVGGCVVVVLYLTQGRGRKDDEG